MSDKEFYLKVEQNKERQRKEAVTKFAVLLGKAVLVLLVLLALEAIGFISGTFLAILAAGTVCYGAFKAGYIWRDIKF